MRAGCRYIINGVMYPTKREIDQKLDAARKLIRSDPVPGRDAAIEARDFADTIGHMNAQIEARICLARAYLYLANYRRSLATLESAENLLQRRGPHLDFICRIHIARGAAYHGSSEFSRAVDEHRRLLNIAIEHDLLKYRITAFLGLGEVELELRRFAGARKYFADASRLLNDHPDINSEIAVLTNLGTLALRDGQLADAHAALQRALDLARAHDDRMSEAEILSRLGGVESRLGNTRRAETLHTLSLQLAGQNQSPPLHCRVVMLLADFYRSFGQEDRALELYRQALQIARTIGTRHYAARLNRRIAEIHERAGRLHDALTAYKRYMEIRNDLVHDATELCVQECEHDHESDRLRIVNERIETTSEIAREVTSTVDIDDVIDAIYPRIERIMQVDVVKIALADHDRAVLDVRVVFASGKERQRYELSFDDISTPETTVVTKLQPVIIDDYHEYADTYVQSTRRSGDPPQVCSAVYLPLLIRGRLLGVFAVKSTVPRAFSALDVRLLTTLAAFIAAAVDNALVLKEATTLSHEVQEEKNELQRAYERITMVANHDDLTGLANRRMFYELFDLHRSHAIEHGSRMALIFLDLDRFKPINDNYGHESGDLVLVEIGFRLKSATRAKDIVARIGGDEFVVIVPTIPDVAAVQSIADKIRRRLSEPIALVNDVVSVGASIGIACYPDDGDTSDDLLRIADTAMYAEKGHRRG